LVLELESVLVLVLELESVLELGLVPAQEGPCKSLSASESDRSSLPLQREIRFR
jgi:hypothetical protein